MPICRSCGSPITWGESVNGKLTPMDPDGQTHFITCPQRREWRKRHDADLPSDQPMQAPMFTGDEPER
jgi:hypothetical protein